MKIVSVGAAALLFAAMPASAGVILQSGTSTAPIGVDNVATLTFNGSSGGATLTGLSSQITLQLLSQSATKSRFAFTVTNLTNATTGAGDATSASRMTSFGFNVNPDVSGASISNLIFDTSAGGSNISGGNNKLEVCFTTQNCSGGGSDGLWGGQTTSGTFDLDFLTNPLVSPFDISLSNFMVRYQSVAGSYRASSAQGTMTSMSVQTISPVPEPATWTMLLTGFGMIGFAMRRQRRSRLIVGAATA